MSTDAETQRSRPDTDESAAAVIIGLRARVEQAQARAAQLEQALVSNRRIGMAMGVLMARLHIQEDDAFALLRVASQRRNVKLRDVAEAVLLTGTLEP